MMTSHPTNLSYRFNSVCLGMALPCNTCDHLAFRCCCYAYPVLATASNDCSNESTGFNRSCIACAMAQQHLLFARHGWLKNGSTSASRILCFLEVIPVCIEGDAKFTSEQLRLPDTPSTFGTNHRHCFCEPSYQCGILCLRFLCPVYWSAESCYRIDRVPMDFESFHDSCVHVFPVSPTSPQAIV